MTRISQSFVDEYGKQRVWEVDLGSKPGWHPVLFEGRKTGYEILHPGDTDLGIQARFLGSRIGPRKDFEFSSAESALAAVIVYRNTPLSGSRPTKTWEPDPKADHAGRSAGGPALADRLTICIANPLAWSLRSRPGSAADFTVWYEDFDTGSRIVRRDDGRWAVTHASVTAGEEPGSFDSLGAALAAIIAVAKVLSRSPLNA